MILLVELEVGMAFLTLDLSSEERADGAETMAGVVVVDDGGVDAVDGCWGVEARGSGGEAPAVKGSPAVDAQAGTECWDEEVD
jgi:hypothetical protein